MVSSNSQSTNQSANEDYQTQIENLQKTRAVFQAIKEATGKIQDDIYQVHKVNNPTILAEANALKDTIDKVE